jgi:hypothetical protein
MSAAPAKMAKTIVDFGALDLQGSTSMFKKPGPSLVNSESHVDSRFTAADLSSDCVAT